MPISWLLLPPRGLPQGDLVEPEGVLLDPVPPTACGQMSLGSGSRPAVLEARTGFAQWRKQTERSPGTLDAESRPEAAGRALPSGGPGVCVLSSAERVWGCVRPGLTQGHCVRGAFRTLSLSLRFDCGSESPFRRDFPPRLTHAASCV